MSRHIPDVVERALAVLGAGPAPPVPIGGGSLSSLWRAQLHDGRCVILKQTPAPRIEASMLQALAAAGAPVPAVLGVDDAVLVLEALASDGDLAAAWPSLGRVLGRLHRPSGAQYGWPVDYAFGDVPLGNEQGDDWVAFWRDRRLLAPSAGLPGRLRRRIDALAPDVSNRLPQRPPVALLHGDLWGGNVVVAGGRVSGLIDPACYYGDAEVDLAMLALFNEPAPAFYEAYGALAPGFADRVAIYQLWPAIVHVRLFGSGYVPLVERLLEEAGV